MEIKEPNKPDDNSFNGWVQKWKDFQPAAPRRDSLKAICWMASAGAFLHPVFAYMPAKWPLLAMDGFLLAVVFLVLWHERNVKD